MSALPTWTLIILYIAYSTKPLLRYLRLICITFEILHRSRPGYKLAALYVRHGTIHVHCAV